jgi:hypothetical protein
MIDDALTADVSILNVQILTVRVVPDIHVTGDPELSTT